MTDIPSAENDTAFRWSTPQVRTLARHLDTHDPHCTSYPTVDRLRNGFGSSDYLSALYHHVVIASTLHASLLLYMRLLFCANLRYYCGRDKAITEDRSRSARYVETFAREMTMMASQIGPLHRATQLHWGGGMLAFFTYDEIRTVVAAARGHFDLATDDEVSVKPDPYHASDTTLEVLAKIGLNRADPGIQDFSPDVQRVVHHIQGAGETRCVVDIARRLGFESISLDLIYGLPYRRTETFSTTLGRVLGMVPDRLSVHDCAHLPHLFRAQRRIDMFTLPTADEKLDLLAITVGRLVAEGYVHIGMDHLVRPDDAFAIAQCKGRPQHNFQGYSTHTDCDMLAFGVPAISRAGDMYTQSEKDLDAYYARIDAGELAVLRDMSPTPDNHVRHAPIGELICGFELDAHVLGARHGLDFERSFADELQALVPLEEAGLVKVGDECIIITSQRRLLVRRIAMVFDTHLRKAGTEHVVEAEGKPITFVPRYSKMV